MLLLFCISPGEKSEWFLNIFRDLLRETASSNVVQIYDLNQSAKKIPSGNFSWPHLLNTKQFSAPFLIFETCPFI
ncbi:hypothetical protein L596_002199 [Steinernema carpocapsae]|uniref:Uncharacterized protein n=1 Tax=Steinernema carpocapsae TaxID=34508 RepID=A0A4U8UNI4_STECR|nr:hypothetical protein L596_002199 [Steinernema carpocapsae]